MNSEGGDANTSFLQHPYLLSVIGFFLAIILILEIVAVLFTSVQLMQGWILGLATSLPLIAVLVYAGLWLKRSSIPATRYRRINLWAIGGFVIAAVSVTAINVMAHEIPVVDTVSTVRWAGGIGAVIGAIIGLFEAQQFEYRSMARRVERERDRFHAVFEKIPVPAIHGELVDGEPHFLSVNEAFEEVFGYSSDDVKGRGIDELVVPSTDRNRASDLTQTSVEEGHVEAEVTRSTATGERRFLLTASTMTPQSVDGEPHEMVVTYADITDLHEREQELRETNQRLELVLEGTETGIWKWELGTEKVGWDETLEQILGLEPGSFAGTYDAFAERIHPDDRSEVEAAIEHALENDDPYQGEFRMIHEDGETVWAEVHGVIVEEENKPNRMIGIHRNITERKERERDLERLETVVKVSGDPIYTLDESGHFSYVNDTLVELTGYDESTLLGEPVSLVMEEDDIKTGREVIRSLLRTDADRETFEFDLITKAGNRISCENQVALLPFEDEFRGTVGVLRDITERAQRERALQRERDRLDQFAGVVSHDLRNPLSVAQGYLELAREETESDHHDDIAAALDRIQSLIEDLLTLAREGNQVGEWEMIQFGDLVESCWANVATAGATLSTEIRRPIRADESRLQQLIENLMRNAVEHGDDGVRVTVGELDNGFFVEDDGPGIPPADRDDVFDTGYSTSHGGTGFGLAIVQEIAEAHGWDIQVTEGSDGGARFEITGVELLE